jgi:hypothetical protein
MYNIFSYFCGFGCIIWNIFPRNVKEKLKVDTLQGMDEEPEEEDPRNNKSSIFGQSFHFGTILCLCKVRQRVSVLCQIQKSCPIEKTLILYLLHFCQFVSLFEHPLFDISPCLIPSDKLFDANIVIETLLMIGEKIKISRVLGKYGESC